MAENNEDYNKPILDSDSEKEGIPQAEAIEFFIYHEPNDKLAVNGFKYVIKHSGKTFQVFVREGNDENTQHTAYESGGEDYLGLIESRHALFAEVQKLLSAAAPQIITLLDDIKLN